MRARLRFVIVATGCAVSAATACSSPPVAEEAQTKKTTQASSVTIEMLDPSGKSLGSCSGTLVAKDLVLTAGHCAAGVATWKVDARGAEARSTASRAVSPWKKFGSDLSHPDHADVALLVLDKPIKLEKYPSIATSKLADGASVLHFHRASASANEPVSDLVDVSPGKAKGFRLNYLAKVESGQFLDTGGAIVDPKTGKIHGVVSGKGKVSGLLHVARVDNFAKWITRATTCEASASSLSTRGYPPSGGSSGGSSSGGYGGGGGGSGWGGDDWGGYGGDGKKLDGGAAPPMTDGGGGSSGTTADGGSGSTGDGGASGSTGTPGGGGGDSSSQTGLPGGPSGGTCPPTPSCEGSDCPGKNGPGTPGSMTPGDGPGDEDGDSDTTGEPGGSSGKATPGEPGDEVCPGPPSCPEPDSQTCSGPSCGGCGGVSGCVDATIDYGNCASCGASGGGAGSGPVVR